MFEDELKRTKTKLLAEIELGDGTRLVGEFFVAPKQRLSDLLNDERQFLPVELADGSITLLRKRAIDRITPLQANGAAYEGEDPYRVLGISESADAAEIKQAYRSRIQEYHPDRLAALGLAEEFVLLAHKRAARINAAYETITRLRTELAEPGGEDHSAQQP